MEKNLLFCNEFADCRGEFFHGSGFSQTAVYAGFFDCCEFSFGHSGTESENHKPLIAVSRPDCGKKFRAECFLEFQIEKQKIKVSGFEFFEAFRGCGGVDKVAGFALQHHAEHGVDGVGFVGDKNAAALSGAEHNPACAVGGENAERSTGEVGIAFFVIRGVGECDFRRVRFGEEETYFGSAFVRFLNSEVRAEKLRVQFDECKIENRRGKAGDGVFASGRAYAVEEECCE